MNPVLYPPKIIPIEGSVIFLAGPIQGAPPWQEEAIQIIQQHSSSIHIANPKRSRKNDNFIYGEQVDWETHFLNRAAQKGCILFWLANEAVHYYERPYAQTSRFELGEWKAKHEIHGIPLVVGIDDNFSNARYIRRRFGQDCPQVPLCDTLEATCKAAVELANLIKD